MKQLSMMVISAILGGVIAIGIFSKLNLNNSSSNIHELSPRATNVNFQPVSQDLNFTYAAEKAMPAVVNITSKEIRKKTSRVESPFGSMFDLFGESFEMPPQVGTGSGVIISTDGYIVTNNHVIDGADEVEVTLLDNRTFRAIIVGTDPKTDIAVIKIEANNLPTLPYADSDAAKIGEWVLAIGSPLGLNSTVTAGIISAKGRDINILRDRASVESFIQTDAAVNPGNSGGALINTRGELVGINTAIATKTGYYQGYSFAVPINLTKKIVDDIINYGDVQRGYLGVMIQNLDSELAKEIGTDITEGVYIADLVEDGAAKKAGIIKGDIITEIEGVKVKSFPNLQEIISRKRPGESVNVKIIRDGKTKSMNITLQKANLVTH